MPNVLITWGLYECNFISQPGIIKLVNNNTFDTYINRFSDHLKKWLAGNDGIYGDDDDRRAYLRSRRNIVIQDIV